MRVVSCLIYGHNLYLVVLAAIVCVLGSFATTRLFRQSLSVEGLPRGGWIFLTGVCAGSAIWSTHFIAMLGYEPPAPVSFDATLTLLSVLVAVVGCCIGFGVASWADHRLLPIGGATVGLAVAAMHFIGMFAYRVEGVVSWRWDYLIVSIVLGVVLAASFLVAAHRWTCGTKRHAPVVLLVLSIVSLHFTAMAAFEVLPLQGGSVGADSAAFRAMAIAVALVGFIIVGTGVTSYLIESRTRADSEEKLRHMALHDSLTGLPNRANLYSQLESLIIESKAQGRQFAVAAIDLDHFKELNDVHGHEAGDQALCLIAERMRRFAGNIVFSRVGGDEFLAIAPLSEEQELMTMTRGFDAVVFAPLQILGRPTALGASIGVSVFPRDGASVGTLVGNADLAMYRAKSGGEGNICFYNSKLGKQIRDRRQLAQDLERAIDTNALAVHYQVQTSTENGQIIGYEALLRWQHPERGNVPPAEFIPLAEENGLILELGEWVLRQACWDASRWEPPYPVAVNLSALQLTDPNLTHFVHGVLLDTGLPPSRLELELTETALIRDRGRSLHTIRQIKALGVKVALDDFGTGYSSLDMLRAFPFDKIKLDRSFVSDVCTDAQARAIVRAVTAMGQSLSIPVLAEGIETPEQLALLRNERCNGAQGYLMGRPMPLEDLMLHGGPRLKESVREARSRGDGLETRSPNAALVADRGAA